MNVPIRQHDPEQREPQVFLVAGRPRPKARPRIVRSGDATVRVYTPSGAHEQALAWEFRAQRRYKVSGPVGVAITIVEQRWRGDIDNLAKLILDALTKAEVWSDDRQVESLLVARHHGDEELTRVIVTPAVAVIVA